MVTDAIYEERGSDWSHHVSDVATTRWLQRDLILLIFAGCRLRDLIEGLVLEVIKCLSLGRPGISSAATRAAHCDFTAARCPSNPQSAVNRSLLHH